MRRLGRAEIGAMGVAQRDLAAIEAAEGEAEAETLGEEGQVVGGFGMHRSGVPSGGAACTRPIFPNIDGAGSDAVAGTMKNSLSIPAGLRRPRPVR